MVSGIALVLEYIQDCLVGTPTVVGQQSLHVFKEEHFGLKLVQKCGVVIKHRAAHILQAQPLSRIAEGLARRAAGEKIQLTLFDAKLRFQIAGSGERHVLTENVPAGAVRPERVGSSLIQFYQAEMVKSGLFKSQRQSAGTGK